MAPGPPDRRENMFSLLSESPKNKKKRHYQKTPIEFPDLPIVQTQNPKYITLAAKNTVKPITEYSCFVVHRAIQLISKEIISIATLRDGSLLMLVKSKEVADKFLKTKQLPGICDITCKLHESLNNIKGTVYAPFLNNIPEEEIVSELKAQHVTSVYKFNRIIDGTPKPTGVVLITFDLYTLPSKLSISWNTVKVREYIPNPMRCKNCQLLGHTVKHCKNQTICINCNFPPHSPNNCSRSQCANCGEEHSASSPTCKKYQEQKEVLKIKTRNKCTMREAKILYKQQNPITNSFSYSSVTASSFTSVNETQMQTSKDITNKNKNIAPSAKHLEVDITYSEFEAALSQTKGKTPGFDRISYPMIKNMTTDTKHKLIEIFNDILQHGPGEVDHPQPICGYFIAEAELTDCCAKDSFFAHPGVKGALKALI
ncbi:uncharacterized protein LOC125776092 [Bactrocera dorsalis]|uniref:Uncharacterized protein LOC125776092 n=1 Tax=Bactrocera dorsalis TaxID=27457 RepID=A0ABM3J126_BACDO|nr:uncharacterized protein LOC125776092 [Bactrocera dorsalis]